MTKSEERSRGMLNKIVIDTPREKNFLECWIHTIANHDLRLLVYKLPNIFVFLHDKNQRFQ